MRKLFILFSILFLFACASNESDIKEIRNEQVKSINENMDNLFATDSLTDIWHIEDHIYFGEELDVDRLFRFTDNYILDEEAFESLNGYEKGLAMKTSVMISKTLEGKYEDIELFEKDLEEYYHILENGDEFYIE